MLGTTETRKSYVSAAYHATPKERAGVGAFMGTVYAWMASGLALSAFVAYQCAQSEAFMASMMAGDALFWVLILSPFLLIFVRECDGEKTLREFFAENGIAS